MPGYKLIVKNAKVILKTATNAVLNITGIKDLLTGDGSVDSNNKINWTLQEYTNTATNFTSNNPILLLGQKGIETDDLLTAPKFKIGDGVTAWNTLPYFSIGGSSGVQSVTGPQVDDTDPLNPIVNPLGLIKIVDLNGELFTNLTTAKAYIRNYIDEINYPITNESFENKVFYFTVPRNTATTITEFMSNTSASFIDRFGLFIGFNYGSFNFNNGNNYFGKPDIVAYSYGTIFDGNSFESASGINTFSSFDINSPLTDEFGKNATGKFIFNDNIGQVETANFVNFFTTSTTTIWANASKYTSNLGGINGNLQTAITNGCNVFFDGIDKEDKRNKSTSVVTDQASNIKYPSVKSVYDWVISLLSSKVGILHKDITTSTALTGAGSTSPKLMKSFLIPGGTLSVGSILDIEALCQRNIASGVGSQHLYFNTTNTLSGATLIGINNGSALRFSMFRRLLIKHISTNTETMLSSAGTITSDPALQSYALSVFSINWNNDVWIIQAFANSATSDSTVSSYLMAKTY